MKKFLKAFLWLAGALIGLVALFHAEEYLRGRYLWERHLRELAARGDSLDIRKYIPPPIPDDQNMAAAPIFAELFATNPTPAARLRQLRLPNAELLSGVGWRDGHKVGLGLWRAAFSNESMPAFWARLEPLLKEVEIAARRPLVRFPIHYEDGYGTLLPHIGALFQLAKVYRLKALVELESGQTDAALANVRLVLRLAGAIKDEPILMSCLARTAMLQLALQPVWEGLADHRWKADQLELLQQDLTGVNLLPHLELGLQSERCAVPWMLEQMLNHPSAALNGPGCWNDSPIVLLTYLIPKGWFYINCLNMDLGCQRYYLPCVDSRAMRLHPEIASAFEPLREGYKRNWLTIWYHIMEAMLIPSMGPAILKIGVAQTSGQCAATACALERYRLAHDGYPETMEALVPSYLPAMPRDVMDGQPLRYRREGADGFVLYSIGWNLQDNGGQAAWTQPSSKEDRPRPDDKSGDWVWRSQPLSP